MAPIGDRADRDSATDDSNGEDRKQNLWSSILSEVQKSTASKLPSSKSILVLGENETGKTTLIAKLQGAEDPKKGSGLEYHYIDVKDEYRDDQTKLGVWILDGNIQHRSLLKFALTQENFADTLVLLVTSMAQPWAILESLQKWAQILQDHINRLRIPPEQMREYEQSLVWQFQEYVEPDDAHLDSSSHPRRGGANPLHPSASGREEEKVLLPLGENTLTNNTGIPVVVVITKSDSISTLEKENDYREEHFDFIQQHIRKFCLSYGAALFYTSVKEGKNCDLLYRYLVHRIYGFPFHMPALVVERDAVFIPSGWDNDKKISFLYENLSSMKPDDKYEDVIAKPVTRKPIQREAEVLAEEDQVFLMKQQTNFAKAPVAPTAGRVDSPMRPAQSKTASPRDGVSPKKLDTTAKQSPGTSEGVLANFFNSLLSKKTGAGGASPAKSTDRSAATRDAAAELDRMQRSKQKPVSNQTPNSTPS